VKLRPKLSLTRSVKLCVKLRPKLSLSPDKVVCETASQRGTTECEDVCVKLRPN
jgi:hypothetical protein